MSRLILASGLSKRYNAVLALNEVGFEIAEGQSLAFIGPNGAGKSSLLRILAGISRADSGILSGLEAFRAAYVPDSLDFPAGGSAFAWLSFVARLKGAAKGSREAAALAGRALESMGLTERARRPAAGFSRGMKQRLLFAQALIGEPDLLLLDEPASGLDPLWTIEWKDTLCDLKRAGATIVFSTHRIDDAFEMADRVLLFDRGKLLRDEAPGAWRSGGEIAPERRFLSLVGRGQPDA